MSDSVKNNQPIEKAEQHDKSAAVAAAVTLGTATADDSASATAAATSISPVVEKTTPSTKRTPKRMTFIERAQLESEQLVRNMGGSLELEGGRRTRSSSRRTASPVVVSPVPAKKARGGNSTPTKATSAAAGTASKSSRAVARGRGRKLANEIHDDDSNISSNPENDTPNASAEQESADIVDEETEKPADAAEEPVASSVVEEKAIADKKPKHAEKQINKTAGAESVETAKVNDDKIDGASLETLSGGVSQANKNQIASADAKKTETIIPMEVGEDVESESVQTTTKATVVAAELEKSTTEAAAEAEALPEPEAEPETETEIMEIDAGSEEALDTATENTNTTNTSEVVHVATTDTEQTQTSEPSNNANANAVGHENAAGNANSSQIDLTIDDSSAAASSVNEVDASEADELAAGKQREQVTNNTIDLLDDDDSAPVETIQEGGVAENNNASAAADVATVANDDDDVSIVAVSSAPVTSANAGVELTPLVPVLSAAEKTTAKVDATAPTANAIANSNHFELMPSAAAVAEAKTQAHNNDHCEPKIVTPAAEAV